MKKIGITCDNYKADKFRKGLKEAGYTLEFDGFSGVRNVHLFRMAYAEGGAGVEVGRVQVSGVYRTGASKINEGADVEGWYLKATIQF